MKNNSHHSKQAMILAYFVQFMRGLHENKPKLIEIKSAYDNFSLLGQLLCAGTDISRMRTDSKEPAAVLDRISGCMFSHLSSERILHRFVGLSMPELTKISNDEFAITAR